MITVNLTKAEAEELQNAISDLLCWSAGFAAASPDDHMRHPYGIGGLRKFNLKLKREIGNNHVD